MLKHIQVREYARLTTDTSVSPNSDLAIITPDTFNWLVGLSEQSDSGRFISFDKPDCLRLHSYVGYLQSPAGEGIEVLPKISNLEYDSKNGRAVLCKMLCSTLHLPYKEAHAAQLTRMNLPIHEWIYNQFLTQLNKLIASGLRFDYLRVEEESKFIRSQLNVTAQQRQTTERAHLFHIRHDIYHPNRLENRLIKSALGYIQDNCRSPENWRLANELSHILSPVQSLSNPMTFIPKWSNSKTLHNYKSIRPWCELILEKMNPHFQKGSHRGISLLFPMERLFEEHVAVCLKKLVNSPWQLKTQASSKYMIEARDKLSDTDKNRFYLKPDLLINFHNKHHHVMDTKWKLINGANNQKNFDLSQSDIYQLFAYGHKYIGGNGDLMLIYPKHEGFNVPLPYFKLDNDLRLWVVPFCIESDRLVNGAWTDHFLTFKAAAF